MEKEFDDKKEKLLNKVNSHLMKITNYINTKNGTGGLSINKESQEKLVKILNELLNCGNDYDSLTEIEALISEYDELVKKISVREYMSAPLRTKENIQTKTMKTISNLKKTSCNSNKRQSQHM